MVSNNVFENYSKEVLKQREMDKSVRDINIYNQLLEKPMNWVELSTGCVLNASTIIKIFFNDLKSEGIDYASVFYIGFDITTSQLSLLKTNIAKKDYELLKKVMHIKTTNTSTK